MNLKSAVVLIAIVLVGHSLIEAQVTAPAIEEAGICKTPEGLPRNIDRGGTPVGTEMLKVTLADPAAVCNDGSPYVFYIRPAEPGAMEGAESAANKWVIYLQAGGGCFDAESCRDRWCAYDSYSAAKMSSRFAPDTIGAKGIFRRVPENQLGNRNQVFAYYCSSDGWYRSGDDFVLQSEENPELAFTVNMKGHDIINAMLDSLESGTSDDLGQMQMPDLREADDVLFVGSSAGSNGIRQNADRVRDRLVSSNPDVTVRAVTDATFSPTGVDKDDLPLKEDGGRRVAQQTTNRRPDESCVAAHPGNEVVCIDHQFVQLNHMTTPFFVRMDLTDGNAYKNTDREEFPTRAILAGAIHDQVSSLRDILGPNGAIERDQMTTQPGAFSPNCGAHIALTTNARFFDPQVQADGAPSAMSFHDTLWNWMQGQEPSFQLTDKPPANPPTPVRDVLCAPGSGEPEFVSVNSASFAPGEPLAPGSIAAGFGASLAPDVFIASALPLPTSLGGTSVEVTDSQGVTRLAELFFASPGQINYLVPPETAFGPATVTVRTAAGAAILGEVEIVRIAPALYTANSSGNGLAAALFLRVAQDGTQTTTPPTVGRFQSTWGSRATKCICCFSARASTWA